MSAGVGITPILSMLSSLKDSGRPILWLHGARNGKQHPYRSYLVGLAKALQANNFTRRVWYSEPLPDDVRGDNNDALYHFDGLMDLAGVKELLPLDNKEAMYFFCGPQGWMQHVAQQLQGFGVPKDRLAYEVFGPAQEVISNA